MLKWQNHNSSYSKCFVHFQKCFPRPNHNTTKICIEILGRMAVSKCKYLSIGVQIQMKNSKYGSLNRMSTSVPKWRRRRQRPNKSPNLVDAWAITHRDQVSRSRDSFLSVLFLFTCFWFVIFPLRYGPHGPLFSGIQRLYEAYGPLLNCIAVPENGFLRT